MKPHVKQLLLKLVFVTVSLLILFNLNLAASKKTTAITQGFPIRLVIPIINVDAPIQQLGVITNGEMDAPSNAADAGWFKLGSRPGEKGSAVIAGHFNGINDEVGVFFNLYLLKKGDKIYIKDDKGRTIAFVVRESRIYDPGYADSVFSRNDGTYLNLITCDGVWDGVKKSYSKRLVVFADIID